MDKIINIPFVRGYLYALTIVLVLFGGLASMPSCSKENPAGNTTTHNDTIPKACLITQTQSYDASNTLITSYTYFYTGNRLDSVVGYTPSTSTRTTNVYQYSIPNKATILSYTNGVINQTTQGTTVYFDANGNLIRQEFYNNSALQSYSTNTYNCN